MTALLRRRSDDGVVGVMIALLAVVFILLLGLVVNWGLTNFKQEESQQIADSAAYGLALRCAQDADACSDQVEAEAFIAAIVAGNSPASNFDVTLLCFREYQGQDLTWGPIGSGTPACTDDPGGDAGYLKVGVVPLNVNDDTINVPFDDANAQRFIESQRIGRATFSPGTGGGGGGGGDDLWIMIVISIQTTQVNNASFSNLAFRNNTGNHTRQNGYWIVGDDIPSSCTSSDPPPGTDSLYTYYPNGMSTAVRDFVDECELIEPPFNLVYTIRNSNNSPNTQYRTAAGCRIVEGISFANNNNRAMSVQLGGTCQLSPGPVGDPTVTLLS